MKVIGDIINIIKIYSNKSIDFSLLQNYMIKLSRIIYLSDQLRYFSQYSSYYNLIQAELLKKVSVHPSHPNKIRLTFNHKEIHKATIKKTFT